MRVLAGIALVLCVGGCTVFPGTPPALAPVPPPTIPPSKINVTLKTPWSNVTGAVDDAIPKCGGSYPDCQGTESDGHFILQRENAWEVIANVPVVGDIGLKGSIWRWSPPRLTLNNGTIAAGQDVLYHAKVGPTGVGALASCGYGQPARSATISLWGDIGFAPDWTVDANLDANVTMNNLCQLTFLNVDATPFVRGFANRVVKNYAQKAHGIIRDRINMRDRAAAMWASLQQPVQLGDNIWLTLSPTAAYAGRPSVAGSDLTLAVGIEANPKITIGSSPIQLPSPLPPLNSGGANPEFNLFLIGSISNAEASRQLSGKLVGQEFRLGGDTIPEKLLKFKITDVQVSSNGPQVVVAVTVTGAAKGTLYLAGTPRLTLTRSGRKIGGTIAFDDLDFTVETRNVLVKLGNWILHSPLRRKLIAAARFDISAQLQRAYENMASAINRDIAPGIHMHGTVSPIGAGQIWVSPDGPNAYVNVKGQVSVVMDSIR
jgi:hypothetical protein